MIYLQFSRTTKEYCSLRKLYAYEKVSEDLSDHCESLFLRWIFTKCPVYIFHMVNGSSHQRYSSIYSRVYTCIYLHSYVPSRVLCLWDTHRIPFSWKAFFRLHTYIHMHFYPSLLYSARRVRRQFFTAPSCK